MKFEEWFETEFSDSFKDGIKKHVPDDRVQKLVRSYLSFAYSSGLSQGFDKAVDMQRSSKKWWQF